MVWYEIEGYHGCYAPRAETKDRVGWFLLGLLLDVPGAVAAYMRVRRQTPKIWPMHKRAVKWAAAGCVVRYLVARAARRRPLRHTGLHDLAALTATTTRRRRIGMEDKDKETGGKRRSAVVPAAVAALCVCVAVALVAVLGRPSGTTDSAPEQDAAAQEQTDGTGAQQAAEPQHVHDWTITYTTVHHDAVTHTETVAPTYGSRTSYHTVCNECQQVIDGKADEHIRETGHAGYSTNVPITDEVVVSEGYTREVTDTPAYDETVPDKMVCTTCGATQEAPAAATS